MNTAEAHANTAESVRQSRPLAIAFKERIDKFKLFVVDEILRLPPVEWLIDGMLEVGAQAVLFGPSGEGKTFVAIDWALCVGTGRPWQERMVKQGPVVYVVAEGGRGIRRRVAAWLQNQALTTVDNAFFLLEAVQLRNSDDFHLLIERLKRQNVQPCLIVLDTFARCFVGGDENTSKDVGEFIDACRRLNEQTGATILVVHHTGKTGDQERGSSALRAAADAMIKVSVTHGSVIAIENDKQKDEEQCPIIRVRLERIALGGDRQETSCIVVAAEGEDQHSPLTDSEQRALTVLRGFPNAAAESTDWRKRLEVEIGRTIAPKTFDNWRRALIQKQCVESVPGERHHYCALPDALPAAAEGPTATAIATPLVGQDEQPILAAATATTP
jgi:hypothetical protein